MPLYKSQNQLVT